MGGKTYAWIQLTGVFLLFAIPTIYILLLNIRRTVADKIDLYRCKPLIMPFIEWFDSKTTAQQNFRKCMGTTQSTFFQHVSGPLRKSTMDAAAAAAAGAASVDQLTQGTQLIGHTVIQQVEQADADSTVIQTVAYYAMIKLQAFFDKLSGLVYDVYNVLLSIMDAVNIVLALPEIVMKILAFMLLILGLTVVITIAMFTVSMLSGISMISTGLALMSTPFTAAVGAAIQANGIYIVNAVALGIYMVAITLTTAFTAFIMAAYIPLKMQFKSASKASYCCFSGDTQVSLYDGTTIAMHSVRSGDRLSGPNSTVLGTLLVRDASSETGENWFSLPDDRGLVYGDHKVFFSDRRQETVHSVARELRLDAIRPPNARERVQRQGRVCLVTSDRLLRLGHCSTVFTDYQEHCPRGEGVAREAARSMALWNVGGDRAKVSIRREEETGEAELSLDSECLIPVLSCGRTVSLKRAGDVAIGDVLAEHCGTVIGIYEQKEMCTTHRVLSTQLSLPQHCIFFNRTTKCFDKLYNSSFPKKFHKSSFSVHFVTTSRTVPVWLSDDEQPIVISDFVGHARGP